MPNPLGVEGRRPETRNHQLCWWKLKAYSQKKTMNVKVPEKMRTPTPNDLKGRPTSPQPLAGVGCCGSVGRGRG